MCVIAQTRIVAVSWADRDSEQDEVKVELNKYRRLGHLCPLPLRQS